MVPAFFLFKYILTIAKKIKNHLSIVVLQYTIIKFRNGGIFLNTIFNFRLKHTKNYLKLSKEPISFFNNRPFSLLWGWQHRHNHTYFKLLT